ncbi:HAD-IA family hydrolase [Aliiglaciecola sp. LCG003]|uniref:HAD-IA family hydrolase n=1 Tax=Aliiglaciecola sp. LCG003 TaxID=3053655 RepID=UPI0025725EA0|nr:HAD-IA family hydrolase [Aliiglaciecola sp. LCG003]WJG09659.1 HAD-IA family hydrolase [Aliiglaciecola sp. LCG003]
MIFYRKMTPVKALSFDLDDTLYDNYPLIVKAEQNLHEYIRTNYPNISQLSTADWRQIKNMHLNNNPNLASDMGELRRRTLSTALESCGYLDDELKNAVNDCFEYFYYHRSNFKVDKTICSLLSDLAQRLPLVAITNGNVNLEQIGIADFFSHSFKSNLRHPMKPHPTMFNLASEALSIPINTILHVGDNLEKDVKGSIAAGMQSAWYAHNRPMQIEQERTTILPHVHLHQLAELRDLII